MIKNIKHYYDIGKRYMEDAYLLSGDSLNRTEMNKRPYRYDIINFLLSSFTRKTTYLEIGVRNPNDNYNKIMADVKYSVDPGVEFKENPVDFKMTSDAFFERLRNGEHIDRNIRFELIFIDGLHLADQVDRDIEHALAFLKDDGFLVMHDCNPPTEWHARETHGFEFSPAGPQWNGSTWKAFLKARYRTDISSCCIDTDWGVGIISKHINLGATPTIGNPFYEFYLLDKHRKEMLNLLDFERFQQLISKESH
ncbi:MAG: class I SAM-dependent methyltransferase [Flavobacteriales bacterium]|nr:class I SAM-dependent methyltransferase [Flavobacteriales bacterium]